MKKLILLVFTVILFFSCSKSSSDDAVADPTQTSTLLTRIETTSNSITSISNVTYNGNKIIKVTHDNN